MPFYEYICQKCLYEFEELQKLNDPSLKKCPKCCNDSLKKLVSSASFSLKGEGWYETDFKNKANINKKPNHINKKDSKNSNNKTNLTRK